MTRDELRRRSEGALDVIEAAQQHTEALNQLLRDADWLYRLRAAPELITAELDREPALTAAIARVDKLAPSSLEPLVAARKRLAKVAAERLDDLGVPATATRLEDLLAQLVARTVDQTRERDRIAESWKRLDKRRRNHGLVATAASVPALGSFVALASMFPVWVAI